MKIFSYLFPGWDYRRKLKQCAREFDFVDRMLRSGKMSESEANIRLSDAIKRLRAGK